MSDALRNPSRAESLKKLEPFLHDKCLLRVYQIIMDAVGRRCEDLEAQTIQPDLEITRPGAIRLEFEEISFKALFCRTSALTMNVSTSVNLCDKPPLVDVICGREGGGRSTS